MERVFSGIQPTGELHIGNYFGAIKNWIELQKRYDCLYCIVDYHALTAGFNGGKIREYSLDLAADLLACGIDPEKSVLFIQSHVPEHTELAWIFSCFTSYGDLQRMTQFKDKSERQEFVSAGLFSYPVLQAADILLYKAKLVPVGEDQIQHLELTNRIAKRFNSRLGKEFFPEVKPILSPAQRIMSLADPGKKMSKSLGPKHFIGLMESRDSIQEKIRSAVTDPGLRQTEILSPGVENLFLLLKILVQEEIYTEFLHEQKNGRLLYKDLKEKVFESLW
ncbi:MAG: tryptophan--tRNA ligase, partial [Nitrospinota bacterium]